jgi:hypothetical protein
MDHDFDGGAACGGADAVGGGVEELGGRGESGFGDLAGGPEEAVVDFVSDLVLGLG